MFYELSDKRNIIHEQCMKIAHYAIRDLLTLIVHEHPFSLDISMSKPVKIQHAVA